MLEKLLAIQAYHFMLVLLRIGSALMFMPGFSATYVPMRIRLLIAIMISLIITPVIAPMFPEMPNKTAEFGLIIVKEISIGLFIGMIMQFIMAAINLAGNTISTGIGLSQAQAFDPTTDNQSMIINSMLGVITLTVIFVTDIHHLMLNAVVESYYIFPPASQIIVGDLSNFLVTLLNKSFYIGFALAAPFTVFSLIVYVGMGLLARFMPQMNVFFVISPAQILLGFGILMISLSFILMSFLRFFENTIFSFMQR